MSVQIHPEIIINSTDNINLQHTAYFMNTELLVITFYKRWVYEFE